MIISLGFIRSSSQVLIKDYHWSLNTLSSRIIDVTDLADQNLEALFIGNEEDGASLISLLDKEKAHYPILLSSEENLNYDSFESLSPEKIKDLYLKVLNRWTMHQNFNSVENMWKITSHFRDLWKKDRLAFFEELWYWMKRNVGATELTILFNDVIKSEEKDENNEKRERPKLVQSLLSGTKKGNFTAGGAKEKELMSSYIDKFHDVFEVTEFNAQKAQFVATAQIERSPMIIMARATQLNPLQRSVLLSLFNGLQV